MRWRRSRSPPSARASTCSSRSPARAAAPSSGRCSPPPRRARSRSTSATTTASTRRPCARALVDAGALGPLLFVRGRYGHGGRPGYGDEWRSRPEISGGGELLDQGTHLIDLARWFLGELELEYASTPRWFWPGAVEDNCFLALRGRPDTMAWLHAGWTEWKNLFSLEITGRDGKLQLDGLGGSYGTERLTLYRMLPALGPPETTIWEYPVDDRAFDRSFELELEAFAGARPGDTRSLEDALAVLALTDAAYAPRRP
jgi:predicted dehydrogenase